MNIEKWGKVDPEKIANECSPRHIQSVIEDAKSDILELHALNQELVAAYRKAYNAAAGFSNYCEDSASTRRCEREMEEASALFRAAIAKAESIK